MPRGISLSPEVSAEFQPPIGFYAPPTLLSPQELSNHTEPIRYLGRSTINGIGAPGEFAGLIGLRPHKQCGLAHAPTAGRGPGMTRPLPQAQA